MQLIAENVTQIYLGQDRACRCGCKGDYVTRGDRLFDLRLKRFVKMYNDYTPSKDDIGDNYINISYGNDRAIAVYFD